MRLGVPLVCALTLVFGACSAADEGIDAESVTSSTLESVPAMTTVAPVVQLTATTEATTTEATTTTVPVVAPMVWQRVADDGTFADSSIRVVVEGGPGLVAGGWVYDADLYRSVGPWGGAGCAALWVSDDGAIWERVGDPSVCGVGDSGTGSGIFDIAVGPLGFVAVGSHIWISPDGFSWSRVYDLDGNGFVFGVTAGGPGWVAVGANEVDGLVWVSSDGLEWVLIEDEDLLAGDTVAAELRDVTLSGPGLVAVGSVGVYGKLGDADLRGAVWISEDGVDWQRLPDDTFDGEGVFEGVTSDVASGRIIAFGPDGIWHSIDAREWARGTERTVLWGPPPSSGVAWDADRAVAGGEDFELSVWASLDGGLTWHGIEPDGVTFTHAEIVHDVALVDSRFVAVGETPGPISEPPTGVVWIGEWTDR